jgi:hypothetical protein
MRFFAFADRIRRTRDHLRVNLTAPSRRRRALLLDAMRRAHLGYDKVLRTVRPEVETMAVKGAHAGIEWLGPED